MLYDISMGEAVDTDRAWFWQLFLPSWAVAHLSTPKLYVAPEDTDRKANVGLGSER